MVTPDQTDRPCADKRPTITLTLEALPSVTPAPIRVRQFLKRTLRGMGLRCVSISGSFGSEPLEGEGGP